MFIHKYRAAEIDIHGIRFGLVEVPPQVLEDERESGRTLAAFQMRAFPGLPIVLRARDAEGVPKYYRDLWLVRFRERASIQDVPMEEYTFGR